MPAFSVRVELPPAVTEVGLNEAVAPEGRPLAESATLCALPLVTAVEIVEVPEAPWLTVTVVGLALMEKSLVVVPPPQPANLKEPMRVCQLNSPMAERYSVVYQKVQSSLGSTLIIE